MRINQKKTNGLVYLAALILIVKKPIRIMNERKNVDIEKQL